MLLKGETLLQSSFKKKFEALHLDYKTGDDSVMTHKFLNRPTRSRY